MLLKDVYTTDVRNAVGVAKVRRSDATGCRNKHRGNADFYLVGHRHCTRLVIKPTAIRCSVNKQTSYIRQLVKQDTFGNSETKQWVTLSFA